MSFVKGKSAKDVELLGKKSQFYVEFLGWMETRGLRGQRYTEPVIRELRRRQDKMGTPPKLTIQVSRKELKISQEVEDKKKRSIKKIKFPSIPGRDVTFVQQASRPGDGRPDEVVACIYLGYMPRTKRFVHVHVYRFDSADTATAFATHMLAIASSNIPNIVEAERKLAAKGEIDDPRRGYPSDALIEPTRATDSAVGSASSGYSDDDDRDVDGGSNSPTFCSQDIDPDLQSLRDVQPFDNVTDELKFRMKIGDGPLLLPPKDYDTISRAHGNLNKVDERRCLNLNIVGDFVSTKDNNGSNESGVDLASPGSVSDSKEYHNGKKHGSEPASPAYHGSSAASSHSGDSSSLQGSLHRRSGSGGLASWQGSQHSVPSTPGTPPPLPGHLQNEMVYPPKVSSPPVSPRLYRQALGNRLLQRQTSGTSENSARLSQHSDQEISYYSGSNGDLYAMPFKGQAGRLDKQLPPADYQDDNELVTMRRDKAHSRHNNPGLTRSMPADMIRSEMALGAAGGEVRGQYRRTDSPVFVGGGRTGSPAFAARTDSPSFRGSGRISSPAFGGRGDSPTSRSSQNFISQDVGYPSARRY